MERFCEDLKEHAAKINDYEKKKMMPLTIEVKKLHFKQKVCYVC